MPRKLRPLAPIAAIALLIRLLYPSGFPTYDTAYALLWGDELAHGQSPDYGAPLPPTPHPLADLWGALLSPLDPGLASDATTALAYLALGGIAYLVFRLGALWFDRAIGVVAAAIVLTRPGYLSDGLRAYIDFPYIALVLAALVIETRRPRCGWPVLALLMAAGLLRPEAWLFSAAYLGYLLLERDPRRAGLALRRRATLNRSQVAIWISLAAAAPLVWGVFDWATAGDPLYSFTGTRETVDALGRRTGPLDLVRYGPPQLGEILQWPGIAAAAAGVPLCLAFMRRRSMTAAAALVLALATFSILAIAGLAILSRYTALAATVLAIFGAAALLGWRLLPDDHPWRGRWQAVAAVIAVAFAAWVPTHFDELSGIRTRLEHQHRVAEDLHRLVDSVDFRHCMPISVPNYRAVPGVAAWLDLRPEQLVTADQRPHPRRGYFLVPANRFAVRNFLVDPGGHARLRIEVPPGFRLLRGNRSWRVYMRCG